MTKPVIMFDIDGVVTDNSSFFEALKETYPTVDTSKLVSYSITTSLLEQGVITEKSQHSDAIFFEKNATKCFYQGRITKGFLQFYNELKASGLYRILFITARANKEPEISLTKGLFERFGIEEAEILMTGTHDKLEYLHLNNLKPVVIFEDRRETIEEAMAFGIPTVCVAYSYNRGTNATYTITDFKEMTLRKLQEVINQEQGGFERDDYELIR